MGACGRAGVFAAGPLSRSDLRRLEVTNDVIYRDALDYLGNPVQLHLDIYQPTGDTAASRPVIVWMHGGYFIFGDKRNMAEYARAFARRGYVGVSLQYRLRSGIPISDAAGIVAAAYDAYDDATAAITWLRSHAAQYRIDPDAIAAGGYSAGAVTALNLAYLPGQRGPATSTIEAAVSIAGLTLGHPQPGEPPAIVFHGTDDTIVPFSAGQASCLAAQAAGISCEVVPYPGAGHEIVSRFQDDIVRRTANFLAQHMLNSRRAPDQPPPPAQLQPTPPSPTPHQPGPTPTPAPALASTPRFTG